MDSFTNTIHRSQSHTRGTHDAYDAHDPRTASAVAYLDHFSYWYGGRAQRTQATSFYDTTPPAASEPQPERRPDLDDISLSFAPGSITLLCGLSGSGKSSIIQALNGLIPHFHAGEGDGHVVVSRHDIAQTELTDCGMQSATVFQNPRTQFFTTCVRNELAFRWENQGRDPDWIRARVADDAAQGGITPLLDSSLTQLSGGQLQKIACVQAAASDTPLLLFDEPTSNLSVQAIDEFAEQLREYKRQGRTIVIAEHRLYFLRGLIARAFLIENGRIARSFTGDELFSLTREERASLGLRSLDRPAWPDETARSQPSVEPVQTVQTVQTETPEAAETDETADGLHLRSVRFSYGPKQVLNIDRLDFPAGRISVIIGPNGAGKSTLARIICGLERPDKRSRLLFDGVEVNDKQRVRNSYIVMQDVHRQLFSDSVLGELTVGMGRKEAEQVDGMRLLDRFGLAAKSTAHPLALSGGQKQRLVIAAAETCHKNVYVFDEPTSGVDWKHLRVIVQELRRLADQGAVVIVITHDGELLESCADHIVRLLPLDQAKANGVLQAHAWSREPHHESHGAPSDSADDETANVLTGPNAVND